MQFIQVLRSFREDKRKDGDPFSGLFKGPSEILQNENRLFLIALMGLESCYFQNLNWLYSF